MASYLAERLKVDTDGGVGLRKVKEVVTTLLSVSPLHDLDKCEDVDKEEDEEGATEEAANFTAQTHANHIRDVLQRFYDIVIDNDYWVTNQTADNVSSNKPPCSKLLGINHVCCESHLLNSEVKLWHNDTSTATNAPGYVIDKIKDTMN